MNTIEKQIMNLVKIKARGLQLTQKQIARDLNVSLPTVKRLWSGRGVSLTALGQLCSILGLSLAELLLEVEGAAPKYSYTLEQEKMLVQKPRTLALFDLLISGVSAQQAQKKYQLKESELVSMLIELDRVGLIELKSQNQVKLKQPGEPSWIPGGPLSLKYRKQMIDSLLNDHPKNEVTFFIHDYLPEDVVLLRGKMKELENLMQTCNVRGGLKSAHARSYGSYFTLKEFEWDLREVLKFKKS